MPKDKYKKLLDIENLTLRTPSKATLVRDLSLVINEKDHLLVSGLFVLFIYLFIFLGGGGCGTNLCKLMGVEDIYWHVPVLTGNRA